MLGDRIAEIVARFGRRGVVPPMPPGRSAELPSEDAAEEVVQSIPAGSRTGAPIGLFIVYRASGGAVSQRRISCKRYDASAGNLHAICHERRAMRCFKLSRIEECVIAATGEVIAPEALIDLLPEGGPIRDRRLSQVLTLLVFLMKCDGQAHAAEREEIEAAAGSYALRFDKDEDIVQRAVRSAAMLSPDIEDAIAAIRAIEADAEGVRLARLIRPFVDRVVMADGKIASQEAYFGGIVRDALDAIIAGEAAF